MMKFKVYKQLDGMDCGPTCLRMVSSHYGRNYSLNKLRELTGFNREGVSMLGLSETAEKIGFRTTGAKLTIGQLKDIQFPAILHWNQNHFVVLYKIKQSVFYIADPARGLMSYSVKEFLDYWLSGNEVGNRVGIALLLTPSPDFFAQSGEKKERLNWGFMLRYLYPYKKLIFQ
ncbi:MAG: peptidase domain-containing ABC transporter, partial [Chitinophagaceae bacterium]